MNRNTLLQPWTNQRAHSWWQSLLVIAIFFWLMIQANAWAVLRSYDQLGLTEGSINYMELLAHNQWVALILQLLLIVGLLFGLHRLNLKVFTKRWFNRKDFIILLRTFAYVFVARMIYSSIVMVYFPDYQAPDNQQAIEGMFGHFHWFYLFVTIVIAAPLYEEILLRGLIMKYIFGKYPVLGALAASIAFTLMHSPQGFLDFMTYYLLSAGLTFVYWRTRKLEYAILWHLFNNASGYCVLLLLDRFGQYLLIPV